MFVITKMCIFSYKAAMQLYGVRNTLYIIHYIYILLATIYGQKVENHTLFIINQYYLLNPVMQSSNHTIQDSVHK